MRTWGGAECVAWRWGGALERSQEQSRCGMSRAWSLVAPLWHAPRLRYARGWFARRSLGLAARLWRLAVRSHANRSPRPLPSLVCRRSIAPSHVAAPAVAWLTPPVASPSVRYGGCVGVGAHASASTAEEAGATPPPQLRSDVLGLAVRELMTRRPSRI